LSLRDLIAIEIATEIAIEIATEIAIEIVILSGGSRSLTARGGVEGPAFDPPSTSDSLILQSSTKYSP
jgi:hypothetical protein